MGRRASRGGSRAHAEDRPPTAGLGLKMASRDVRASAATGHVPGGAAWSGLA